MEVGWRTSSPALCTLVTSHTLRMNYVHSVLALRPLFPGHRRVASETLNEYGNGVGYRIRFQSTATAATKIVFLTEVRRSCSPEPTTQILLNSTV